MQNAFALQLDFMAIGCRVDYEMFGLPVPSHNSTHQKNIGEIDGVFGLC
jgi:hypothetical protein